MNAVGGLVGISSATGSMSQSFATGAVSGTGNVGGLVGDNLGGITNAYATGPVDAPLAYNVGGLVGLNSGTVSDVYATGTVIGKGNRDTVRQQRLRRQRHEGLHRRCNHGHVAGSRGRSSERCRL